MAAHAQVEIRRFTDIVLARSPAAIRLGKQAFYQQIERPLEDAYGMTSETMALQSPPRRRRRGDGCVSRQAASRLARTLRARPE